MTRSCSVLATLLAIGVVAAGAGTARADSTLTLTLDRGVANLGTSAAWNGLPILARGPMTVKAILGPDGSSKPNAPAPILSAPAGVRVRDLPLGIPELPTMDARMRFSAAGPVSVSFDRRTGRADVSFPALLVISAYRPGEAFPVAVCASTQTVHLATARPFAPRGALAGDWASLPTFYGHSGPFAEEVCAGLDARIGGAGGLRLEGRAALTPGRAGWPHAQAEEPLGGRQWTPRSSIWKPPLRARWNYQIQGEPERPATGGVDTTICSVPFTGGGCVRPDVFEFDLYECGTHDGCDQPDGLRVNRAGVAAVHASGGKAICYVAAGDTENWRPDYQEYVDWDNAHGHILIGPPFSERFPQEFWVNINNDETRAFVLSQIRKRTEKCARAGFDAIEYDIIEDFSEAGFGDVPVATERVFQRALAAIAHSQGLAAGMKNCVSCAADLEPSFDFSIDESCNVTAKGCDPLRVFNDHGKPIFNVQYGRQPAAFCPPANQGWTGFNAFKKSADASLYAQPWTPCR